MPRLGQEVEDGPIRCSLEVQARLSQPFVRDDPGMVADHVQKFVFDFEARHITTGLKGVLPNSQIIQLPDKGTGSGSENTVNVGG